MCGLPIICILIGSCWLIIAFVKDITNDLSNFKIIEMRLIKNRAELKVRFFNMIRFYSDAKELGENSHQIDDKYLYSFLDFRQICFPIQWNL